MMQATTHIQIPPGDASALAKALHLFCDKTLCRELAYRQQGWLQRRRIEAEQLLLGFWNEKRQRFATP